MARTYKKKIGGRKHTTYDPKIISAALKDIEKGMSVSAAGRKHGIRRETLRDKSSGKHMKKSGGQTALTKEEEVMFVKVIKQLSEWSFPLTKMDIRLLVKNYLNKKGKNVRVFKNNLPGVDFVNGFMKRNNLTQRLATNIVRSRASVSREDVSKFFENIKATLKNACPNNIFNFDETNFSDDPGAKKVVVLRGCKRVERIMEHYKMAVSLMFCISAAGDILPPFVVYKGKHLYENWCTGGPAGAHYSVSKSGWFDNQTFEQWFERIFLPFIQKLSGEKIVICDNLASHFSPKVIDLCLQNNIIFTTIPPNSTHIMQPLDVAFFKPLKVYWRNILETWRKETRQKGCIPKEIFPSLLSRLYEKIRDKGKENAKQGFRKTGLHPLNPNEVLRMLPDINAEDVENDRNILNQSVLQFLQDQRGNSSRTQQPRSRGKKITPGCPVTADNLCASSESLQTNNDKCKICHCNYENYRGPDWIQCVCCTKWICGFCNGRSRDPRYMCEICQDEE